MYSRITIIQGYRIQHPDRIEHIALTRFDVVLENSDPLVSDVIAKVRRHLDCDDLYRYHLSPFLFLIDPLGMDLRDESKPLSHYGLGNGAVLHLGCTMR